MNRIKVWPHMTIVAVVVALIVGLGVAFWMKQERTASAEELPYAARIQRVDGEVAFSDNLPNAEPNEANTAWVAATPNQPFSTGDRIYTRDNARTSLAFSGRNFARVGPNTSIDVVSLEDRRTQLALRDGTAMFDIGYLASNESFEVATPNGAVTFDQPGLYNLGFDNNGGVLVSVLSGLARVVGPSGSGEISKGEMLTLLAQAGAELALSRLNPQDAGYQVDDYYRYQYPNSYDGRYSNYDAYLDDPYYYDPYRRNVSYKYASSVIPGIHDLDYYGDWRNVDGYGYAWSPRVETGWVPYQQGYWSNDYPYGLTWVSNEPWGYAPYHYGRWANVGNQWYWVPDAVNTTPAYAPALVGFVPLSDNQIGWFPLGPGDTYAPRYYDSSWQPHYLSQANVVPGQLINFGIPGAVTVVSLDAFGRPIDPRSLRRIDPNVLASLRPTLDPLTLTPLRNAVINSAWGRGKIDLPPGIAKKLDSTRVFVAGDIRGPRFGKDMAKSMRVERVSDTARNQKFKVKDQRQESQQVDHGRKQEIDRLNTEAKRGNKEAERQVRQLEQQQAKENKAQPKSQQQQAKENKAQPKAQQPKSQQQPQGERVGNPAKPQPPAKPKPEQKKATPAQPAGQGQGKGKGKGKP